MNLTIGWKPVSRSSQVASTRIRCLIPMEYLRKKNYSVGLYEDNPNINYDIVVFNKTHDIATFNLAIKLKEKGIKIVFDLCDNYFYNPNKLSDVKKAKNIIIEMMKLADINIASSDYLAEQMANYVDYEKIQVIEDAVDEFLPISSNPLTQWLHFNKYRALSNNIARCQSSKKLCLVWFGIAGGGKAEYGISDLNNIKSVLHSGKIKNNISLTVISNNKKKFTDITKDWQIPTFYIPWHPHTFTAALRLHDVSVIPISQNPFTLAKTNNRLALSLYHGLPVIADTIPSYEAFNEVCILDNWSKGLEIYLRNPDKRFSDVENGRKLLFEKWSSFKIGNRWETLFHSL